MALSCESLGFIFVSYKVFPALSQHKTLSLSAIAILLIWQDHEVSRLSA